MSEATTRGEIASSNQFEWVIAFYAYETKSNKIIEYYPSKEAAKVGFSKIAGLVIPWQRASSSIRSFPEFECFEYHPDDKGFYMLRNYDFETPDLNDPNKVLMVPIKKLQFN